MLTSAPCTRCLQSGRPSTIPVQPHACSRRFQIRCGATHQPVQQVLAAVAAAVMLNFAPPAMAAVAETSQPGSNVGFMSDEEVEDRRVQLGFRRAYDGRVALLNHKNNTLWDVKLDLKSPGTLLLRNPEGLVHYLAYDSFKQIDLSDDEVCGAIANSPWEANVKAVQAVDEKNELHKFELTREGFYELISVVDP